MSSRLSDSSDSSGEEIVTIESSKHSKKAHYLLNVSSKHLYKIPRISTNDTNNYETSNIQNFYDNNCSFVKSNEELEEKTQNLYYHNNVLFENYSSKDNKSSNTSFKNVEENNELLKKTDSIAERMMKKWGYETGKGLGSKLQGRSEPISTSTQKGRRGLGLTLKELEKADIEYDPKKEIIKVKEDMSWLQNDFNDSLSDKEIIEWQNNRKEGKRKCNIDDEIIFCDEIILLGVLNSKSVFERLDNNEMREARIRSNPFETIRGSIFLNRAAVKMANIDKACNFIFTKPANFQTNELLYFADVCAGPGGFSEYILWRKNWRAKGFGFTLKNDNDFKLHDFYAGPCETFHPYYGPKNDGNIYDPENQIAFKDLIMVQTNNQGVHFMMADGGFSVEGQENIQEILSKQLYLCQCLVALMIVRVNGHFVTKMFDLFTPFSAGLIYIMYRCFNKISIFKPNSSRPANSERYLICEKKKPNTDSIVDYLFKTNEKLLGNSLTSDILELVPVEKLTIENKFFEYLKSSNETLGQKQIISLKKIAAYVENKNLLEPEQKVMRDQCLEYWGLPNQARILPRRIDPSVKAQNLLQNSLNVLEKSLYKDAKKLSKDNITNTILPNQHDWYCMPSSCEPNSSTRIACKTTFYLGMGRSQIYKYTDKGNWEPDNDALFELPRDTLIYAEMVTEMRGEERSLTKIYGLHILDAFTLGGENISQEYLSERIKLIQLFCKALWKPVETTYGPVRVKELFPVNSHLDKNISVKLMNMKNGSKAFGYFPQKDSYENDEAYYYILRNIVFFKGTEEPWARHYSSSNQRMYFYNIKNKESLWEIPNTAKANSAKTIQTRVIWDWPSNESLSMTNLINFLK